MRAEVIGVGTEILLGQIANTNARWISERLAETGIDVLHHQVVGDNVERIAGALREALERADVVILTGGLGPTGDDVTREGVAAALGLELRRRPEIEEHLRERFRRMRRQMPQSNLRQADVPEGADAILPVRGTAPGLAIRAGDKRVFVVPGVPAEMEEMMRGRVLLELAELAGGVTIRSRVLRCTGIAEARVGELLGDLFEGQSNPTVAFLASGGEIRVRLTAKGGSVEETESLIAPVADEVRRRLGAAVFGEGEERLEEVVGGLLAERKLHVACGESLTGGGLAARITSVPQASRYFSGSAVCYSPEAKRGVLGVAAATIEAHGMVSEACALEMARGARKLFRADVALALTGVAGPDELEGKDAGTTWVALVAEGVEETRTFVAPGDRDQIRRWAETSALELLRRHLTGALGG